jgi:RNA-binding protein YlmH
MSLPVDGLLWARVTELRARAAKGELTCTPFLTPGEQKALSGRISGADLLFYGGYDAAERRRLYLLPPYLCEMEEPYRTEAFRELCAEETMAVEIRGSGYRELTHRDFLGALLHLGVERDRIGDVCVTSPDRAVLFCDRLMADFFSESLTRVANDAVRVCATAVPADFDGGRRFRPLSDTVASPRADAVVAALVNLSRERAQTLFRDGAVELDYEPCERPDRTVTEGTVIVVCGHGKFIVRAISDLTRKGRYRLLADQYI